MKKTDPFQIASNNLLKKLQASKKQKDPKTWLYKNDLRTPAFMMESLFRLFEKGMGDKDFRGGHKLIKKLEDALGQIDFYDVFYKEFSDNKKISKEVRSYILKKREKAYTKLEKLLHKRNGLESRIKQQNNLVASKKINFNAATIRQIEKAIQNEIEDIKAFVEKSKCNFKYLEEEVHEIRRKIRWISIYSQSLAGIIKLQDTGKKEKWEKKYLTKSVTDLPFNKLPANTFPAHIKLDKSKFFALSWLINELGKLKDQGLRIELLTTVIRKTEGLDYNAATKKAEATFGSKINELSILKQASVICDTFFNKDKVLNGLIVKADQKKSAKK